MSFFDDYFKYVGATEAPMIYHRWTCISMLGALLGRQAYIPFGHGVIYPNQYIMLMGPPGTRKGTAMNIGAKLLRETGYSRFCPDRLSKEQFLLQIKPYDLADFDGDLENLVMDAPSEVYVVAEEFTDFVGQGGMEFMTMLTKLWDNMPKYEHPKLHGKSVAVDKPTVNVFGGNTVQGLALAIPPEALGNGFMSRIIFVQADPTSKKISFPEPVDKNLRASLAAHMSEVRDKAGEISYSSGAMKVLDVIYKQYIDVEDYRFKHYGARRFTHLLKLCIIFASVELRREVSEEDAINANTILHAAEIRMPKALGEFGKSKYSEVSNRIMDFLNHQDLPVDHRTIWKLVAKDLGGNKELSEIMRNLMSAERIQVVTASTGKQGYVARNAEAKEWDNSLLNLSILTKEEMI